MIEWLEHISAVSLSASIKGPLGVSGHVFRVKQWCDCGFCFRGVSVLPKPGQDAQRRWKGFCRKSVVRKIIIMKFKLGRWEVRTWGVVRNMDM